MIFAMIFAHCWCVLQLAFVGSLTRTIRLRTALLGVAVGFYCCSVVAIVLQISWTHLFSWIAGIHQSNLVLIAGYTVDPFIEEIVKVAPLVLLLSFFPKARKQWSLVDCIVIAAALGSGFGLAENIFRYGAAIHRSVAVHGGWEIAGGFSSTFVPSLLRSMVCWLPSGAQFEDIFSAVNPIPQHNLHLEWSAIGGLAVGLLFLRSNVSSRLIGICPLFYVAIDHAAYNRTIDGQLGFLNVIVAPFNTLREALYILPVMALVIAAYFDLRHRSNVHISDVLLARELRSKSRCLGLLRAAFDRPLESILLIERYVRLRRTYALASCEACSNSSALRQMVLALRMRINLMAHAKPRMRPSVWVLAAELKDILRSPKVLLWIIPMIPSFIWLILGSLPETSAFQSLLTVSPIWLVVRGTSVCGIAWLAFRLAKEVRRSPSVSAVSLADLAASRVFRLAFSSAALLSGVYALARSFYDASASSAVVPYTFHVLEAVASATIVGSLMAALGPLALFPPAEALFEKVGKLVSEQFLPSVSAEQVHALLDKLSDSSSWLDGLNEASKNSAEASALAQYISDALPTIRAFLQEGNQSISELAKISGISGELSGIFSDPTNGQKILEETAGVEGQLALGAVLALAGPEAVAFAVTYDLVAKAEGLPNPMTFAGTGAAAGKAVMQILESQGRFEEPSDDLPKLEDFDITATPPRRAVNNLSAEAGSSGNYEVIDDSLDN